jgi:tetratricopeptide (TPR) repeat protein
MKPVEPLFCDEFKLTTLEQRENTILAYLDEFFDTESNYLIYGKLFSHIITNKMVEFDDSLREAFQFQKNCVQVFKTFYHRVLAQMKNEREAEVRAAKIMWNFIDENRFDEALRLCLPEHGPHQHLSIEKQREFMRQFDIIQNLIRIVQGDSLKPAPALAAYLEAVNFSTKAVTYYRMRKVKGAVGFFELALNKIIEFDRETGAKFAGLVGALFAQKAGLASKGLYFLHRTERLLQSMNDTAKKLQFQEMSSSYWTLGMFTRTLDKLTKELELHTLSRSSIGIQQSQEHLSIFYRKLNRYLDSHDWALRALRSTIQAEEEEQKKGFRFFQSNVNYAKSLIGLNSWDRAEKHLQYAEKSISQLEFTTTPRHQAQLEIAYLRGLIAVFTGDLDRAQDYFAKRQTFPRQLEPTLPLYSQFLRSEAIMYRNMRDFPKAIETLQPLFQEKHSVNPQNVALLSELLVLHSHAGEALKLLKHALNLLNSSWTSIHTQSQIYQSIAYIYLLTRNFEKASKWYQSSLEINTTDLSDLRISLDSHMNLAYMAIEGSQNIELAKRHCATVEEFASASGSISALLDAGLLRAYILKHQGEYEAVERMIQRVANEANGFRISYIQEKAKFLLNHLA